MTSKAFEQIIKEYGGIVFRVALSRTGNADSAQDVYQQVFLLLYEKKPTFADSNVLKIWLIRAAIKYAANARKRENKTEPIDNRGDTAVWDGTQAEFLDLLYTLPESLRDVTVLFYIEDMSVADIAGALGITRGSVKTRLSRARNVLAKIYKEELL